VGGGVGGGGGGGGGGCGRGLAILGSGPIQDKHGHKYVSATVIVGGGDTQTPRHLCVGTNDCKGWPDCSMLFGTA